MRRYNFAVAVAAAALFATAAESADAQQPACTTPGETVSGVTGRALDQFLQSTVPLGFSGEVLVSRGDEILLNRAYGFANRAAQRPMTNDTAVGIASLSKMFTAAAILRLQEQRKLHVQDRVGQYVTGLPDPLANLTLHQLLTHTAALRGGDLNNDFEGTRELLLQRIAATHLVGTPGERWRYANIGYNLLAAVIEAASGQSSPTYLRDAIFAPAGMRNSGVNGVDHPANSAVAYRQWSANGSPSSWSRNWRMWGEGDVFTTASDLWCWRQAIVHTRVLNAASVQAQRTAYIPIPDTDAYGYGMFSLRTDGGRQVWEHGGDTELGDNALYREYPDGVFVAIVSNGAAGEPHWDRWAVQNQIEQIVYGQTPTPLPQTRLANPSERIALAGDYARGDAKLHVIDDGALLWVTPEGQAAVDRLLNTNADAAAQQVSQRTATLLSNLTRNDAAAWRDVGEYASDLSDGWNSDIFGKYGAIMDFRMRGVWRDPRGALTALAGVRFLNRTLPIRFIWRAADGPMIGIDENGEPYADAEIMSIGAHDRLIVSNMFEHRARTFTRTAAGLRDEATGEEWRKIPAAGWTPP